MTNFSILEKKINITFKNKELLIQAFCHRSYLNESSDFSLNHNERMEFLGDAVLELVITEYLYREYPNNNEGELTSWRASLVNTKILSQTSEELGFNDFIMLSKGESSETGRAKQSIMADTFEALVGAIYLDGGYDLCKEFIRKNLIVKLPEIIELELYKDSKSRLQEESQSIEKSTPVYKIVKESGPDHRKIFTVEVMINGKNISQGQGFSKHEAEENAAKKALEKKGWKLLNKNK